MKKTWILPCLILVVLIAVWFLRWDNTASKTYAYGVVKWKTDRWTGQNWMVIYGPTGVNEKPLSPLTSGNPQSYRNTATTIWVMTVVLAFLWLIYITQIGPYIKRRASTKPIRNTTDSSLNETPENNSNIKDAVSQIRPWVRYWARLLDYMLFGFLVGIILAIIVPNSLKINNILIGILIAFVWIFIESFLLVTFGTTPGKWLLKTSVHTTSGERLDFRRAIQRSFFVWLAGMGACFPIVVLFTNLYSYSDLKNNGITYWDVKAETYIVHKRIGVLRIVISVLLIISFLFLMYYNR